MAWLMSLRPRGQLSYTGPRPLWCAVVSWAEQRRLYLSSPLPEFRPVNGDWTFNSAAADLYPGDS